MKEEECRSGISSMDCEGGNLNTEKDKGQDTSPSMSKMVLSDNKKTGPRPRVAFHIPSIPRPQDEFNILVNNSNQSFEHVWLQKNEDGSKFIHPLEKHSVLNFVGRNIGHVEPVRPLPIESTPLKLVEEVKELKKLAAKLRDMNDFAVDLEHNQYRSFQGLTCLMQISTRTEDFVVDTLKLRAHIGPCLREIFKDPFKKKVMHGADRDIQWLQRDFGIYVCNLFDTGQASRVLRLERNSLEYLLHHFCEVTVNKEYQNADWRLRPLPDEMLKYAREDTHYLLYIYDLMRARLLSASMGSEDGDDLLLEVYERSYEICKQLYEKEPLTDASYLNIYGLQGACFNSEQVSVVAGLFKWRDGIARAVDESTGYVLPNKALLEIARQMPLTVGKLHRLVKSKHPYVEHNLDSVVSIIKSSILNAAAFESAAQQLKDGRAEKATEQKIVVVANESEALPTNEVPSYMETASTQQERVHGVGGNRVKGQIAEYLSASVPIKEVSLEPGGGTYGRCRQGSSSMLSGTAGETKKQVTHPLDLFPVSGKMRGTYTETSTVCSTNAATGATVQVLKKPNHAFGALLENSTTKGKLDTDPQDKMEQFKAMLQSLSFWNKSLKPLEKNRPSLEIQEDQVRKCIAAQGEQRQHRLKG